MTPAELYTILNEAGDNVVCIYFTATWCGPCRKVTPLVQTFVDRYPNLRVYKVDADECKQLLDQHNVSTLPTLEFFKHGQVISRHTGSRMVEEAFMKAME